MSKCFFINISELKEQCRDHVTCFPHLCELCLLNESFGASLIQEMTSHNPPKPFPLRVPVNIHFELCWDESMETWLGPGVHKQDSGFQLLYGFWLSGSLLPPCLICELSCACFLGRGRDHKCLGRISWPVSMQMDMLSRRGLLSCWLPTQHSLNGAFPASIPVTLRLHSTAASTLCEHWAVWWS